MEILVVCYFLWIPHFLQNSCKSSFGPKSLRSWLDLFEFMDAEKHPRKEEYEISFFDEHGQT